jgi:periplasmic copper chaperone A
VSRALPRPVIRPALLPAALALGLALTGCGAGFEAQTYQQRVFADGTNADAGEISIRNISVQPGDDDGRLDAGDDATVTFTLANVGEDDDRLVEAESPAAREVKIIDVTRLRAVDEVEVPARGSSGTQFGLALSGLSEAVGPGGFVEITLRFERNGGVTLQVPVAVTGEYDDERERSDNFHPPGSEDH